MEKTVPCNSCGEWIELNDGRVCHKCRQNSGMCRECWVDHDAWHESQESDHE